MNTTERRRHDRRQRYNTIHNMYLYIGQYHNYDSKYTYIHIPTFTHLLRRLPYGGSRLFGGSREKARPMSKETGDVEEQEGERER